MLSKPIGLFIVQVLGYPSKPIGLFIRRSIIFRSDSNGEDLEGYAGAGLYDRYLKPIVIVLITLFQ